MLLETYALNTRHSYNRLISHGQQMMILMKGNLVQCSLAELESVQAKALAWSTAYGQCMTMDESPSSTTSTPN